MKGFCVDFKVAFAVALGAVTVWVPAAMLLAWAGLETPETLWLLIALGIGHEIGRKRCD